MKHLKTFENNNNNPIYKINCIVDDGSKNGYDMEIAMEYVSYEKAFDVVEEFVKFGWRNKKVLDAHIIKVTREKLNNDDIKTLMNTIKYNI